MNIHVDRARFVSSSRVTGPAAIMASRIVHEGPRMNSKHIVAGIAAVGTAEWTATPLVAWSASRRVAGLPGADQAPGDKQGSK